MGFRPNPIRSIPWMDPIHEQLCGSPTQYEVSEIESRVHTWYSSMETHTALYASLLLLCFRLWLFNVAYICYIYNFIAIFVYKLISKVETLEALFLPGDGQAEWLSATEF